MFRQSIQTIIAITALVAAGTSVAASPASDTARQVSVYYGDLKLDDNASVAKLYSRLIRAARSVCDDPDVLSLPRMRRARECIEQALDRAVADINVATLSALHVQSNPSRFTRQLSAAR